MSYRQLAIAPQEIAGTKKKHKSNYVYYLLEDFNKTAQDKFLFLHPTEANLKKYYLDFYGYSKSSQCKVCPICNCEVGLWYQFEIKEKCIRFDYDTYHCNDNNRLVIKRGFWNNIYCNLPGIHKHFHCKNCNGNVVYETNIVAPQTI